jgi:nicotinamide mononucleotide adenylyltransferase
VKYVPLVLALAIFAAALRLRLYFSKTRPSDIAAIDAYAVAHSLRVISVRRSNNYWRYLLRGKAFLSSVARVFIVVMESAESARRELHVAFDNWGGAGEMQVLQDTPIAP